MGKNKLSETLRLDFRHLKSSNQSKQKHFNSDYPGHHNRVCICISNGYFTRHVAMPRREFLSQTEFGPAVEPSPSSGDELHRVPTFFTSPGVMHQGSGLIHSCQHLLLSVRYSTPHGACSTEANSIRTRGEVDIHCIVDRPDW